MLTFSVSRVVPASNEAIWAVLGDFGTEHRWTRSLRHCERDRPQVSVGTARICTLPRPLMGRTRVREELTEFRPGAALAYVLDGGAGPFATASSRWSTSSDGAGRTRVTVEGFFTPRTPLSRYLLWPLARPMIRRVTRKVLAELADYVIARPS